MNDYCMEEMPDDFGNLIWVFVHPHFYLRLVSLSAYGGFADYLDYAEGADV